MLRIEFKEAGNAMTIRMEGRFVARFAEDARELVARCTYPSKVVVDLSEVSFVDVVGEDVLTWMSRIGVKFVAENAYSLNVCERLHLSLARNPARCSPSTTQRRSQILPTRRPG